MLVGHVGQACNAQPTAMNGLRRPQRVRVLSLSFPTRKPSKKSNDLQMEMIMAWVEMVMPSASRYTVMRAGLIKKSTPAKGSLGRQYAKIVPQLSLVGSGSGSGSGGCGGISLASPILAALEPAARSSVCRAPESPLVRRPSERPLEFTGCRPGVPPAPLVRRALLGCVELLLWLRSGDIASSADCFGATASGISHGGVSDDIPGQACELGSEVAYPPPSPTDFSSLLPARSKIHLSTETRPAAP